MKTLTGFTVEFRNHITGEDKREYYSIAHLAYDPDLIDETASLDSKQMGDGWYVNEIYEEYRNETK